MGVLTFFAWMAVVPGALLLAAASLLAVPEGSHGASGRHAALADAWRSPAFLLCTGGIFAGTFSGLLVIGNLTPIALGNGLSAADAVRGVSAFALGNAVGRILWGVLFDRIQERAIPYSLAGFALALAFLPFASGATFFLLVSAALGFGFGANFVVYASALSRQFGVAAFARLYPVCFLGYGLAGTTGPALGGKLADATGSYTPALYLSIAVLALAALTTWRGLGAFGLARGKAESAVTRPVASTGRTYSRNADGETAADG
jgi:OFA family oxalate/formate antiporter-like MFS transporter